MKAVVYKPWNRLPPSEKRAIAKMQEEEKWQDINKYFAKCQKNWLKILCIVLFKKMGMTVEEIILVLANFREIYRLNAKIETDEEQQAWLDREMDEIFGKGGYPTEYIDKLEHIR